MPTAAAPVIPQQSGTAKSNTSSNEPPYFSFKIQAIIIAVVGLICYFNSFFNEFALDDRPIIVENEFVKEGFAGIPKILTSDAFESYMMQQNAGNALTGGRYRPFSIVTFAIEQQILGLPDPIVKDDSKEPTGNVLPPAAKAKIASDMHFRHVINVLLYILSIIILLHFLRKIVFPGNIYMPFVAAILFLVHPIHTEVVANVKSRDEILSLMFICLTLLFAFRYRDEQKKPDLWKSLVCFFIAILSKEYGVTLLVMLPLALYIFRKDTIERSVKAVLPYLIPFVIYVLMRLSAESHSNGIAPQDVMNIPYLYATTSEKIASITSILLKYFELLLFPHPLASDYSYNQIPYINFANIRFWISLLFYAGVITAMVVLIRRRSLLGFAIAFYLVHLAMIGNVFVNIGAPMGERLIYHSSFGFVIIVAWLLYQLTQRIKPAKVGLGVLFGILFVVFAVATPKTVSRNKDWVNDKTLFLTDINTSPNSVLILGNAGSACVELGDAAVDSPTKKDYYEKGIAYFNRALKIDPVFPNAFKNRGVCYYQLGDADKALADWDTLRKIYPTYPSLPYMYTIISNYYYKQGIAHGKAGRHDQAVISFTKAADARPADPDIWYNIGFANFSLGRYREAMVAFERALRLNTKNPNARSYYEQSKAKLQ